MKQILLTQGQFALVDDADYDWLNQWKWHALRQRSGNFYASRHLGRKGGKRHRILMHRIILGLEQEDKRQTDHKDHNTLDNRRDTLRICTNQQNQMNQKLQLNTSSQFKGVCWDKTNKKWQAGIMIDGKRKSLGYFIEEKEAALAYNIAAKKYFGDFAFLNKIP